MTVTLPVGSLLAITLTCLFVGVSLATVGILGGRSLAGRGEESDVPDEATPELARRLDDGMDLGDVLSRPVLPCGCSEETTAYTCPRECGWRACVVHLYSTHYCTPVPDIAVVNDRFAHLINSPELRGLRRAPESLAPYYLIGDEK